jgi:hypothetical protein
MNKIFALLGQGGTLILFGLLFAVAIYILEKYVAEEPTKPGKLAYLVAAIMVVVGVLMFLFDVFS